MSMKLNITLYFKSRSDNANSLEIAALSSIFFRDQIDIPGRDGRLYLSQRTVNDIQISIEMNFMTTPNQWGEKYREAKAWLLKEQNGVLKMNDDPEWFYRAKKVVIETSERTCRQIGKFIATFTCSGYMYRVDGATSHTIEEVQKNNWEECHPTYLIKGDANCRLKVNGKYFVVNVGQECTIDTERQIAYKSGRIHSDCRRY